MANLAPSKPKQETKTSRAEMAKKRISFAFGEAAPPQLKQLKHAATVKVESVEVDFLMDEPPEVSNKVPRDMRHFGAVLRVSAFGPTRTNEAVADMLAVVTEFTDDEALCTVALNKLISGKESSEVFFKKMARESKEQNIVPTVTTLVKNTLSPELCRVMLSFTTGVLRADPRQLEEFVHITSLAISKYLRVNHEWTLPDFEVLLSAMEKSLDTVFGHDFFTKQGVLSKFEEEWETLQCSDQSIPRLLVSTYNDRAERVLSLMG